MKYVKFNVSISRLQVSLDKINNDGPVSLINFEDLKMENERLQSELDRTKKVNACNVTVGLEKRWTNGFS